MDGSSSPAESVSALRRPPTRYLSPPPPPCDVRNSSNRRNTPRLSMKIVLAFSLAALLFLVTAMFRQNADKPAAPAAKAGETVTVQLLDDKGALTGPIAVPAVVRSDKEWQSRLTPEQYRILRRQGTEQAFCGLLWDHHEEGTYCCRGCGLPLFASAQKFNSGTGWPSYWAPVAKENVREITDNSYMMERTEIRCARCDGHLG